MRITRRKIEQAILDRFGLDVVLVRGAGYYYFASDDDESAEVIYRLPSTSVWTMHLGGVPFEWWIGRFESLLEDGDYIDPEHYTREPV